MDTLPTPLTTALQQARAPPARATRVVLETRQRQPTDVLGDEQRHLIVSMQVDWPASAAGQAKRSASSRSHQRQKPLRCQYSALSLSRQRLMNRYSTSPNGFSPNSCSTSADSPSMDSRKSIADRYRYTAPIRRQVGQPELTVPRHARVP